LKTVNLEDYLSKQTGNTSLLYACILFVGLHSILLGLFIYIFTPTFYDLFFSAPPENIFFVRQSGVFLFCLGVYYLLPLLNFKYLYNMVLFTVFTKIVAVLFLVANASLTLSPPAIYAAALADGIMATILIIVLFSHKKNVNT